MSKKKPKHDPVLTIEGSPNGTLLEGISVYTTGGSLVGISDANGEVNIPNGTHDIIVNPSDKGGYNASWSTRTFRLTADATVTLDPVP